MATHKPAVIIAGTAQDLPNGDGLKDIASIESGLIINDAGAAVDFRVEGDTFTNLLVVNGTDDAVRIGTTVAGALATFDNSAVRLNPSRGARVTSIYGTGGTGESIFAVSGSNVFISSQNSFVPGEIATFSVGGIQFNLGATDLDVTIGGDTAANLFVTDAGLDAVQVGGAVAGSIADFRATAIVLNESGADLDFRVEGDSLTHLIFAEGNPSSENIALVAASLPNWQSMDRGLFIGDATMAPTGNPSAGVFVWSDSGVLKARNAAGNVTTLASPPPKVEVFIAGGTWTKPAGAVSVEVHLIGGGGGGGNGRRGATNSNRGGGGGGGGGGYTFNSFAAGDLSATENVGIGAGGAGAANQGTNNSSGNSGTGGGSTSFGAHASAAGGGGGSGGTTAAGAGGAGGDGNVEDGGNGGAGGLSSNGVAGGSPAGLMAGAGGGGGGGITSAMGIGLPADGGSSGGVFGSQGTLTVGVSNTLNAYPGLVGGGGPSIIGGTSLAAFGGGGGGGGGMSPTSTAAFSHNSKGGAGAKWGGGGGGGGGSSDNFDSVNPAGIGSQGIAVVITHFS